MLHDLQQIFLQSFYAQDSSSQFVNFICENTQLSAQERFEIYRGSITECLANGLRHVYPVCEKLVGKDFFRAMAYQFVAQTPSHSPNLYDYGKEFANFVATFPAAQSLAYLQDICHLEWACHVAYHAKDQVPLDFSKLTQLDEGLQPFVIFELPLGSTLLQSNFPIARIWEVNQEHYWGEPTVYLDEGCNRLLVWRHDFKVHIDLLTVEEWELLIAVQHQYPFESLCEYAEVVVLLPKMVKCGWINGFHI